MTRMQRSSSVHYAEPMVSVRRLRQHGGNHFHIYYFRSPKNRRIFIFCGVIPFIQAIILESDPDIISYTAGAFKSERLDGGADPPLDQSSCLIATRSDGRKIAYQPQSVRGAGNTRRAKPDGHLTEQWRMHHGLSHDIDIQIVTDEALSHRYVQVDNWLMLCAVMNRAAARPLVLERKRICALLANDPQCTLGQLLRQMDMDPACMLAAVAHGLASGELLCDTVRSPLTSSSVITRGGRTHGTA